MKRFFKRLWIISLFLTLPLGGCGASGETEALDVSPSETVSTVQPVDVQLFAMDTFMNFRAYGGAETAEALGEVSTLVQRLDGLLSATTAESEIFQANHNGGMPTGISTDTAYAVSKALDLSRSAGGALALTLYPVTRAWGFASTGEEQAYRVPSEQELRGLLKQVDDSRIILDDAGQTLTVPVGMELDLGAVAKGFAGDMAATLLEERGVTSALLNLGASTIRTLGTKPDGALWRIAVQDPKDANAYAGVIETGPGAVNTSGGYERFFQGEDGEIYWHILDPETGRPAKNGLISVTILSDDATTGDALSTALFVMGVEQAADYWRETGDFEFVLIGDDGRIYISEGAVGMFEPMENYADAEMVVFTREETPEGGNNP